MESTKMLSVPTQCTNQDSGDMETSEHWKLSNQNRKTFWE